MRVGQVEPKPLILDLDVVDKDGLTFFHTTAETVAPFLSVIERSVGLYVAPNRPLPPGTYQVRVRAPDGRSATAPLEIR